MFKKFKIEIINDDEKLKNEIRKNNNKILNIPNHLTKEEKIQYKKIVEDLKESIEYNLTFIDCELIWQFCQIKIIRDRAWTEYNKNPDRYTRIIIGYYCDGKTPKVLVKENEHYKTLIDCNKQLVKILKDLRLTPEARKKRNY